MTKSIFGNLPPDERKQLESINGGWITRANEKSAEVDKILAKYGVPGEDKDNDEPPLEPPLRPSLKLLLNEIGALRKIETVSRRHAGITSLSEQVNDCRKLQRAAEAIRDLLEYFKILTDLDIALGEQYIKLLAENSTPVSQITTERRWENYRDRLHKDTALLADIAVRAMATLKSKKAKSGSPPKTWRDNSFKELVDFLGKRVRLNLTQRVDLAMDLWNLYFPDCELEDVQSAMKIIRKGP